MSDEAAAARQVLHESVLAYGRFRWLKLAALLAIGWCAWYVGHSPLGGPNGGSWLGYLSGSLGAALIVWLALLGIRKRRYRSTIGVLSGWVSAHVYLGLALAVIATLHTGFHLDWNLHTLAYVLMMVVILSGAVGTYFYMRIPPLIFENSRGKTRLVMLREIVELDEQCRSRILTASDLVAQIVLRAISPEATVAAARNRFWRYFGFRSKDLTEEAIDELRKLLSTQSAGAGAVHDVLGLLARREDLLSRLRRDMRYGNILDVWKRIHIPTSFALLVALTAHIVAVLYYR
jgi:hypothetical protein